MKVENALLSVLMVGSLLGFTRESTAALPADFPQYTLLPNANPAPGYLFGTLSVSNVPGLWSNWFAILDNNTNAILLNTNDSLGTLACNGLFVTKQRAVGQSTSFILKDSSFNMIYTNQAGNGYIADDHDFEVLPNGHALIEIYDSQIMDLSTIVPGGYPAAQVQQTVIQEVDTDNNVIFQWRSLDHIPVTDTYQEATNPGDYIHVNSVWLDDTDGNIILSCRNTSEVIKISRATGDIIWRMQGKHNQFTFSNGIPGNTEPPAFQVQSNARRLSSGNLTVFDNGYSADSDPRYGFTRAYSRAVEYVIDEANRTASLDWEFRHNADIITYEGGSVERLPGGHSIIQWGPSNTAHRALAMSEADAAGALVADLALPQDGVTGAFTRVLWPLETNYLEVTEYELVLYNTYVFSEKDINTGVSMLVQALNGEAYNDVTVLRQPFAPVQPRFLTKAPRVLPVRVQIAQAAIDSVIALAFFDVSSFGFTDPANTTVYYRATPGQGLFVPLPDSQYNWATHQLQATISGSGEYIFGLPDVAEVPYPPLLITPLQGAAVNQNLPISFFWTPKGFGEGYHLQVSTNADFSTLVLDQDGLTETRYTNFTVGAGTPYYWRVNTLNDGGLSDWSTNSFTTVPPLVQVTVPNGGEAYQRGLPCIIQWKANVAEEIALDLYKAGAFVQTLTTNAANIPAYTWLVSVTLAPGSDYAIKIRSTTNPALFDFSDAYFSIVEPPTINAGSAARLPDGRVQFQFSAPGTASVTVFGTSALAPASWQNLGSVSVTGGNGTFTTVLPYNFYRVAVP